MVHWTKYFDSCIDFQEWGSPPVHSSIWIFNGPNIQKENAYVEFIEVTINT